MDQSEKELIILEIEKYDSEKDKINGNIKSNLIFAGLFGILAISSFSIANMNAYNAGDMEILKPFILLKGAVEAVVSVQHITRIITSLMKKAGLSHRINELTALLNLDETKGMRR